MKPLDIVKTKHGDLAIVQEISKAGVMLHFIDEEAAKELKNGWYLVRECTVVNSIPRVLAIMSAVTGTGGDTAREVFPKG